MRLAVYRKAHFNAAHRIYNPSWDDQRNEQVFGLCSNPYFHGHNYELEVKLIGEVNPETGYVYDLKKLSDLIKEEVEDRLDHKNLNLQVEYFENVIPSAENICIYIYELLRKRIENEYDIQVRLYETPRNYVEYPI